MGDSARLRGILRGSFPAALTSPKTTAAIAAPCSCPAYQAWRTAAVWSCQFVMSTGPPVVRTTTVRGLASLTARTSSSWPFGSCRPGRSACSLSYARITTTAVSHRAASSAAAMTEGERTPFGGRQPNLIRAPVRKPPDARGPLDRGSATGPDAAGRSGQRGITVGHEGLLRGGVQMSQSTPNPEGPHSSTQRACQQCPGTTHLVLVTKAGEAAAALPLAQ